MKTRWKQGGCPLAMSFMFGIMLLSPCMWTDRYLYLFIIYFSLVLSISLKIDDFVMGWEYFFIPEGKKKLNNLQ